MGRSMVRTMFGRFHIGVSARRGFWAFVCGLVLAPSLAPAATPAIKSFARSYQLAWSAPTPIPLLNLAVHPSVFTDLVALDRWDFLDFSRVDIEVVKHGRTSGSEVTVEILRTQRDHFVQGTYTVGHVRERLVLSPWRGELRIKRFLGANSAVRRSSMPRTWSNSRDSERLLMRALAALAIHDPEVCLDNVYGLFSGTGRGTQLAVKLSEPFEDRKSALSNAFFVRAACTRVALQEVEPTSGDDHITAVKRKVKIKDVLADLDQALELDSSHHLARLLRARIRLFGLSEVAGAQQVADLKNAISDLEQLILHIPDLEDTRTLHLWAQMLHGLACPDSDGSCATLPPNLLDIGDLIPGEALAHLAKSGLLTNPNKHMSSWALEMALLIGDQEKAQTYKKELEILCPDCATTLYLKARWAEQDGRVREATSLYKRVMTKDPVYRDTAWRFAELAMGMGGADWADAVLLLKEVLPKLNERDRVALNLFLSVGTESSRDIKSLLRIAKKRFGDKPLPSSVRKALVRALRAR